MVVGSPSQSPFAAVRDGDGEDLRRGEAASDDRRRLRAHEGGVQAQLRGPRPDRLSQRPGADEQRPRAQIPAPAPTPPPGRRGPSWPTNRPTKTTSQVTGAGAATGAIGTPV